MSLACPVKIILLLLSCLVVTDSFATPWIVALQAPLSMGFPRQEYWSGLPFLSLGDLPDPGIKPVSPALRADSLSLSHLGSPNNYPWIIASCLTTMLFSTKLPPFWPTLFSVAFVHKLSPLVQPDSPSVTLLCLTLNLPIFKYSRTLILRAAWKVHGLCISVIHPNPAPRGRHVSLSVRREPVFICISTQTHGSLLVNCRGKKSLCLAVAYERNEISSRNWWNWELTKIKDLLDLPSFRFILSSFKKLPLVTLRLGSSLPFCCSGDEKKLWSLGTWHRFIFYLILFLNLPICMILTCPMRWMERLGTMTSMSLDFITSLSPKLERLQNPNISKECIWWLWKMTP